MRIAYLLTWGDGRACGVFQKVRRTVRAWQRLGHEVACFVVTRPRGAEDWSREVPASRVFVARWGLEVPLRAGAAVRTIRAWGPDVLLVRLAIMGPGLADLCTRIPTFVDVPGNDLKACRLALRATGSPRWLLRWAHYLLARRQVLPACRGACYSDPELASAPEFLHFGKPALVLGNSVESWHESPPPEAGARTHAVYVGRGERGQGLDRLLGLARGLPDWSFDLIGDLEAEVRRLGAPPNVVLHGRQTPEEYRPILQRASLAFGPLDLGGLRRMASSLKVCEYLAHGLPVVLDIPDSNHPEDADFALVLGDPGPSLEAWVSRIRDFAASWRNRRVPRSALGFLDVVEQERRRLEFMRAVMEVLPEIQAG